MDNIDFGKGKVEFNELHIDINKLLEEQIEDFKEDMLQVKYCDNNNNIYLLDGEFKIVIIKNYDWRNPLLRKSSDVTRFYNILNECIYFADSLLV